jgi:hypothetical protein
MCASARPDSFDLLLFGRLKENPVPLDAAIFGIMKSLIFKPRISRFVEIIFFSHERMASFVTDYKKGNLRFLAKIEKIEDAGVGHARIHFGSINQTLHFRPFVFSSIISKIVSYCIFGGS